MMGKAENLKTMIKMEWEKLYRMPVLYLLALGCIFFNLFLIWDGKGHQLEEMRCDMVLLEEKKENFSKVYGYDYYGTVDMGQVKNYAARNQTFSPRAEQLLESNYKKLEVRAANMTDAEKNSPSFTGAYRLHQFLFGFLLKCIIIEGILLIMGIVIYSMHFEVYYQTEEQVWSSKNGERIYRIKLLVSGGFALVLSMGVMAVSLVYYFHIIDYSSIWNSYVSSNFNTERRTVNDLYLLVYPYITWVPLTIRQYLLASILLILVIFLFAVLFTATLAKKQKNSLQVLFFLVGFFFLLYLLGNQILLPGCLEYVLKCNPVHLILKSGCWFMDYAPGDTYPCYEILTMFIWITGAGIAVGKSFFPFKKFF